MFRRVLFCNYVKFGFLIWKISIEEIYIPTFFKKKKKKDKGKKIPKRKSMKMMIRAAKLCTFFLITFPCLRMWLKQYFLDVVTNVNKLWNFKAGSFLGNHATGIGECNIRMPESGLYGSRENRASNNESSIVLDVCMLVQKMIFKIWKLWFEEFFLSQLEN